MTGSGDSGDAPQRTRSRRGANGNGPLGHADLRASNAWSVLSALRDRGIASRSQLVEATGLTNMSVHRIIGELVRRELARPAGLVAGGAIGRPSSLFRFDPSVGCVIGIDVGNETTRVELADLSRTVLARRELATADVEGDVAGSLVSIAHELLAGAGRDSGTGPGPLVGMAVGVPAIPDPEGTILRPSQHRVWIGVPLGSALKEAVGCPVVVRQDDHLAARAEVSHGACSGVRTAVVLNMGKGVGVGLIIDGSVFTGAHQATGRVAWIPVGAAVDAGDGPGATIAELLTADGLQADYRRLGGTIRTDNARAVFAADASGDRSAARAIELFADRLGWLVAALVAIVDPEIVVLGGGLSRSWARLEPATLARLRAILPSPPTVVASDLGPEAVVTGAVEAAMDLADDWLQGLLET